MFEEELSEIDVAEIRQLLDRTDVNPGKGRARFYPAQ
jgi:hypothetical protein